MMGPAALDSVVLNPCGAPAATFAAPTLGPEPLPHWTLAAWTARIASTRRPMSAFSRSRPPGGGEAIGQQVPGKHRAHRRAAAEAQGPCGRVRLTRSLPPHLPADGSAGRRRSPRPVECRPRPLGRRGTGCDNGATRRDQAAIGGEHALHQTNSGGQGPGLQRNRPAYPLSPWHEGSAGRHGNPVGPRCHGRHTRARGRSAETTVYGSGAGRRWTSISANPACSNQERHSSTEKTPPPSVVNSIWSEKRAENTGRV